MEKEKRLNASLPSRPRYGRSEGVTPREFPGHAGGSGAGSEAEPRRVFARGMEGAVLYQKSIDNSAVTYWHDPSDRDSLRRKISWGLFVVFAVALVTAPRLWVRHSGYRQTQLGERIDSLTMIRNGLKVEKGEREASRRIAELAKELGLRATEESRFVWLPPRLSDKDPETEVAQLFVGED